jgi:hypothetical protein
MTRAIFYVDNLPLAQACVAFAETLGLNVEPDILARLEEGQHLTTASKNFDVNFIKNEAFANKKANEANVLIKSIEDSYLTFLNDCVMTFDARQIEDEVTLEEEVISPDAATVAALFAKVKGQKKSPAKYYVTYRNDQWVATTNPEGSYGNLFDLANS